MKCETKFTKTKRNKMKQNLSKQNKTTPCLSLTYTEGFKNGPIEEQMSPN